MSERNRQRILSICDDDGLRLSRELLLRNSGYETDSATSYDLLEVGYVRSCEIALICPSIDPRTAAILRERLERYNPGIQILDIGDLQINPELWIELDSRLSAGPEHLLQAVREMCDKAQKRSAQRSATYCKKLQRTTARSTPIILQGKRMLPRN